MDLEAQVATHYSRASLEQSILEALAASGKDLDALVPADLSGADEFHLGWRAATAELAKDLGFAADMHVLDAGCGIGGPARHLAELLGCRVTGVDLSKDYIDAATALTRRCGLDGRVSFRQGSALALPWPDAHFDGATLIHVGMNIAAKDRLFAEIHRALKPQGLFGIYDIMRMDEQALPYPMPWASGETTSFLVAPPTYRALLEEAGFRIEQEVDRRPFALERWNEMRADIAKNGPPPLSLHTLIGPASHERLGNVMKALQDGSIAPVQMIARRI